ncbi:Zn-dependent hydrolase [Halorubrum laminariae]|uniref:Zn-dependent hydrolase n=1 Tax=Halorubrum laminariae TaxID=1433523 RepID=A0ABD6C2A2_9EURY|nr:Zn-dependent hydrolase [Halorubrum laminariae]
MSVAERAQRGVREERLRDDITTTADFGAIQTDHGRGRTVLTGTDANRRAREYLVDRLEAAGLDVRVDAVGNIAGRWVPDGVDPTAPPVACGSHLDSVPEGGIFDGVLGVYSGLEAVRAFQETDADLARPIDVVCFTEEEGARFSNGVLGSSVASGKRSVEEALALEDDDGVTLDDALSDIGFRGTGRLDASQWDSWLELHVEQGERLQDAGAAVGIVSAITGTIRCSVAIEGEADHSGSTAMADRTDALAAASDLILEVESVTNDLTAERGDTVVGTVGKIDNEPNAINVVSGRTELGIDVRDVHYEPMETIIDHIQTHLDDLESQRGVETTFEQPYDIPPSQMSDRCVDALERAAERVDVSSLSLHSGAGHDTMHLADVTDTGLLFAPSRGGFSHSPREWTDWSSCAAATQVLTAGLADLACE